VSPEGKTLATGSPERRVTLWEVALPAASWSGAGDPRDGGGGRYPRKVATLEGEAQALSLAFSPDGKLVAAADREGTIYIWNRASGKRMRPLVGHIGPVLALAFSPDSRTLASGGADRTVRLWNPGVDQEEATLTGHRGLVYSAAFSPDGTLLASGSLDGTVRLWRAAALEVSTR
jgi:WD40 repeat protein